LPLPRRRRLPSRGDLTPDHARHLLRLRDAYGDDLTATFNIDVPTRENDIAFWETATAKQIDDAGDAYLNDLRPEDFPLVWHVRCPYQTPCPDSVVEACQAFNAYVEEARGQVPQWQVAAFWWATQAVFSKKVAEYLGRLIDVWRERFDHACWWWSLHYDILPDWKTDRDHAELWWGFQSDLRHSGALERAKEMWDPDSPWGSRFDPIQRQIEERGFIPPTAMCYRLRQKKKEGRKPEIPVT
jgi:hypothetical protein